MWLLLLFSDLHWGNRQVDRSQTCDFTNDLLPLGHMSVLKVFALLIIGLFFYSFLCMLRFFHAMFCLPRPDPLHQWAERQHPSPGRHTAGAHSQQQLDSGFQSAHHHTPPHDVRQRGELSTPTYWSPERTKMVVFFKFSKWLRSGFSPWHRSANFSPFSKNQ